MVDFAAVCPNGHEARWFGYEGGTATADSVRIECDICDGKERPCK